MAKAATSQGKGIGKKGPKRQSKTSEDNLRGVTNSVIRRLARKGGVKRISDLVYDETRAMFKLFLEKLIRDAVSYTAHDKRCTVTASDVKHALDINGRTIYGFQN